MNKEFANERETEGWKKLQDFNDFLHLQELGKTPTGAYADASGFTTTGQKINIENKVRNQTLMDNLWISGMTKNDIPYSANTLYIESHKLGDLLIDYITEQKTPLYINYLNDNVIIVFNLATLRHRPEKAHRRIFSKLYQSFEIADREMLRLEDAYIYRKEHNAYKLIHRP